MEETQSYLSDLTSSGYNGSHNNSGSILESLSEDDSTEMVSIKEMNHMSGASSMLVNNGPSSSMSGPGVGPSMSHMTPMSPRSITTASMSASGKSFTLHLLVGFKLHFQKLYQIMYILKGI